MSKHIKAIAGFVIVALLASVIIVVEVHYKASAPTPPSPAAVDEAATSTLSSSDKASADLSKQSWAVFQTYLSYLKVHDMQGFKNVSYQISEVCSDPTYQERCFGLMDSAFAAGSPLKLSDFTHIIYDQKQVIMYSNYRLEQTGAATGYTRELLYLARGTDGALKLLSFEPGFGYFHVTGTSTPAELKVDLDAMSADTDGDTLSNQVETCTYQGVDLSICKKTDPTKRDTDGDGWWDPIEKLFYTSTPK